MPTFYRKNVFLSNKKAARVVTGTALFWLDFRLKFLFGSFTIVPPFSLFGAVGLASLSGERDATELAPHPLLLALFFQSNLLFTSNFIAGGAS